MNIWQEYEIRDLIRYNASRARRCNHKMATERLVYILRSVHLFDGKASVIKRLDQMRLNLI